MASGDVLEIGAGTYRELVQVGVSGALAGTAITAVSAATNPTITTSAAHGLSVGQTVRITGVVGAEEVNGLWVVQSVPTGTTFTILLPVAPSTWVSGGVVSLPIVIRGDVDGSATGDAGEVIVSGWTTSDTAAQSSTRCTLDCAGHSDLLIQNLTIMGSQAAGALCLDSNWSWGVGGLRVTVQNCALSALSNQSSSGTIRDVVRLFAPADTGMGWWFDRCLFAGSGAGQFAINARGQNTTVADYDIGVLCTNCLFLGAGNGGGGNAYALQNGVSGGSGTLRPGGITLDRCTFLGLGALSVASGCSRLIPAWALNSVVLPGQMTATFNGGGTVFFIVAEDCNYLAAYDGDAYASVFAGAQTLANDLDAPLLNLGESAMIGATARPFLEPKAGFPLLGGGTYCQQTKSPGTAGNDATVGSLDWTNPANAEVPDATYAVATSVPATTGISHYLTLTNWGFNIPSNATVTGIEVKFIGLAGAASAISVDSLKYIKNGVIGGTDEAANVIEDVGTGTANELTGNPQWTTSARNFRAGSPTNLWGLGALAPSDVNASTSGIAIAVKNTAGTAQNASIDYVQLTVFYEQAINTIQTDLLGRPRPASMALDTPGALIRANMATVNSSVTDGSNDSHKLLGGQMQDLQVNIDAATTTVSLKLQYDSSYTGSLRPQVILTNGGECGVADQTITATTSALNAFETETFTIAPTAAGWITLRVVNRSAAASGGTFYASESTS